MSGSTAKAFRRGIRRSLGEHGLQAVDAVSGLGRVVVQDLQPTVAQHGAAIAQHDRELDQHMRELENHWERLERVDDAAVRFRAMSFTARLLWVAFGR